MSMARTTSSADTRQRILTATNELFRRQGFNGTSLSQIVKASQSTTGSLYHFFPGGKDDLTAEVLRVSGAAYLELVLLLFEAAAGPAEAMADSFRSAAAVVVDSDYIDPCPIGTVAREVASTHEALREVAAEVMNSWVESAADFFVGNGIERPRATELASLLVATIEGGFVMLRATRDVDQFVALGDSLRRVVETELS